MEDLTSSMFIFRAPIWVNIFLVITFCSIFYWIFFFRRDNAKHFSVSIIKSVKTFEILNAIWKTDFSAYVSTGKYWTLDQGYMTIILRNFVINISFVMLRRKRYFCFSVINCRARGWSICQTEVFLIFKIRWNFRIKLSGYSNCS